MVGRTKRPTKEQKLRMTTLKENVPCIPCLLTTRRVRMPSIQHVVTGFTRDGHDQTYSACEWHHFGMKPDDKTNQEMSGLLGPPLTWGKKPYQEFFGHERLLCRLADFLLDEFHCSAWFDYNVPYDLRRRIHQYWVDKK